MKTSLRNNLIKSFGRIFAMAAFISISGIGYVFSSKSVVNTDQKKGNQLEQKAMYNDPTYKNSSLSTTTTDPTQINDQQKLSDGPPPPGDPVPNETPVSSSIAPLLLMALAFVFWKIHYQLKKSKK